MFGGVLSFEGTFLSTPSARRATIQRGRGGLLREISIHALREEGDLSRIGTLLGGETFLSTPSARRATCCRWGSSPGCVYFYPRPPRGGRPTKGASFLLPSRFLSTPSARRATSFADGAHLLHGISIHALREEGDGESGVNVDQTKISIHALREEGDCSGNTGKSSWANFYPRPPRGGRPLSPVWFLTLT